MTRTKLSLETILKDTRWVVKMTYGRFAGTYDEIKCLSESEECRDFDICFHQPEHLKDFYDGLFKYEYENGFITIQEYYEQVYNRES